MSAIGRKPEPFVERKLIRGINERMDYKGSVIVKLNEDEVAQTVRDLMAEGVEAIAVCLLWAFINPDHERRIARADREEPPRRLCRDRQCRRAGTGRVRARQCDHP